MANRVRKAISVLLITSLCASLLTGCDLPWGKKKAQQEVVETYLNACFEFDYRKAASCVEDKDDAFQDFYPDSPQLEICETILSLAQFEVEKVDNDRVLVALTVPDIDRALKRMNVAAVELEDLEDILSDTDKLIEEEFEFDLIKDKKEWVIEPESTEEFVEFVSELGLEIAPEIGLGTRAKDFYDTFISCLREGNIDAAYNMMYGSGGYGGGVTGFYGADTNDLIAEFYSSIFGSVDYELEIVSCEGSSVTLEVSGTRADIGSAVAYVSGNDADASVEFLKRMALFYVGYSSFDYDHDDMDAFEDLFYGYMEALVEFYIACIDRADTESFTFEIELEIDENGNFSFVDDPMSAILGDVDEPEFAEGFYEQALDELLASGEITQSEYDELSELDIEDITTF